MAVRNVYRAWCFLLPSDSCRAHHGWDPSLTPALLFFCHSGQGCVKKTHIKRWKQKCLCMGGEDGGEWGTTHNLFWKSPLFPVLSAAGLLLLSVSFHYIPYLLFFSTYLKRKVVYFEMKLNITAYQ